jgi:hypothetical protein
MTYFSIFSCFSRSAGQAPKKKVTIPKRYGNLQAGNFLKYWKKPEHASYQGRREKRSLANKFSFFFLPHYEKANY